MSRLKPLVILHGQAKPDLEWNYFKYAALNMITEAEGQPVQMPLVI